MEGWKIEIKSGLCPYRDISYLCRFLGAMMIICDEGDCPAKIKEKKENEDGSNQKSKH